jgi:hypothetical protein
VEGMSLPSPRQTLPHWTRAAVRCCLGVQNLGRRSGEATAALRCSGPGVAELGRSLSATRQRAAAGAACGCVCVVLEMS